MRLAIIGPVHPYRGGVSQFTTRLAEELSDEDDVTVLSWRRQYPRWLYPGGEQLTGDDLPVSTDSTRFDLDYRNPASIARAVRSIRRMKADAVLLTWTTTFTGPHYLLLLAMLRWSAGDVPVIAICHNVLPHERRVLDPMLARAVLARVQGAVVHSADQLAELESVAPETRGHHLEMPPFGPRPAKHAYDAAVDLREELGLTSRVLAFFGTIRPYKGLGDLIDALGLVDPALDVSLLVVGQFWEPREPYDERIARLGLADRVRIVDQYVDDADVGRYLGVADVVVLPYRHATQSAVVQLAYAHDRPVISTEVGGIPEIVEDGVTGLLVPPESPRLLAGGIERFYREDLEPALRRGIANRDQGGWRRYTAGLREAVSIAARETSWMAAEP